LALSVVTSNSRYSAFSLSPAEIGQATEIGQQGGSLLDRTADGIGKPRMTLAKECTKSIEVS
jgi:hypothetical protein